MFPPATSGATSGSAVNDIQPAELTSIEKPTKSSNLPPKSAGQSTESVTPSTSRKKRSRHLPSEELGHHASVLLDDLQEVIASLVTGAPRASRSMTEATAKLQKSVAESKRNQENQEELRKTLASAKRRRQNVDAMIELMNHLDGIAEMQSAHDDLVLAADHLLTELTDASETAKTVHRKPVATRPKREE